MPTETPARLQRDDMDIVRMVSAPSIRIEPQDNPKHPVRAREGDEPGGMPTLYGHFIRFNEWTVIDSYFEGKFMERVAPGAAKKTIKDRGDKIRCLFQHGRDFFVGDKPLGPFDVLAEDGEGVAYEVPMLDTQYNRELVPGLEAGLYGSSFRMRVMREEWVEEPGVSDYNPDGIPERTIKEIQLFEGGPVTFPAYDSATAAVRSLTDHFIFDGLTRDPKRTRELIAFAERSETRLGEMRADSATDTTIADDLAARVATASDELRSAFEADDTDAVLRAADELRTARSALAAATGADTTSTEETAAPTDSAGTESHPESAPPEGSAETSSHPDPGRRDQTVPTFGATYQRGLGALPDKDGMPTGVLPRR